MTKQMDASLSNDAVELLDCFYNGVDKIVYNVAEEVARRRTPNADPLEIEVDDVREAGKIVFGALKSAVDGDRLRDVVTEEMKSCFSHKTGEAC